jgi:uncharacterized protein YaaQ
MKMAICVVHQRDKVPLADELLRHGFKFTILHSSGGFLREGNATFMCGVAEEELEGLRTVVHDICHSRDQVVNVAPFEAGGASAFLSNPVQVPVGGAVMFVLPVDEFHRF